MTSTSSQARLAPERLAEEVGVGLADHFLRVGEADAADSFWLTRRRG
jgi:hypothetical protein